MPTRRKLLSMVLSFPALLLAQDRDAPAARKFSVTGKVNRPGVYDLRDGMRVYDAITKAGGFVDFADQKRIVIVRGAERHNFNCRAFIRGKGTEENILLQGGDVIVVP
jgi:protein involved in polysaccharide export with SLBB domain